MLNTVRLLVPLDISFIFAQTENISISVHRQMSSFIIFKCLELVVLHPGG